MGDFGSYLFYIFALFAIIWEYVSIVNAEKLVNFKKDIVKVKKVSDYNEKQKSVTIWTLLYVLWLFVGLFTSQWILFLILFLSRFIKKRSVILITIDSFLSLLILLFIILNRFHFNIDLYNYLF